MIRYLEYIFLSLSALVNVVFFLGDPEESVSARSYRQYQGSSFWAMMYKGINTLIFWQKDHCKEVWIEMQTRNSKR